MRRMAILGAIALALASWTFNAEAGCSGSGQNLTCTAGTTAAEVATALANAADGATLTFSAGSYSWSNSINFSAAKGATLICATQGACVVSGSGLIGMNGNCASSTKLYRISGFSFTGSATRIWFWGPNPCTVTQLRIDHNTFNAATGTGDVLIFGEGDARDNYIFGVVDHNAFVSQGSFVGTLLLNGSATPAAGSRGTLRNLVFEDNVYTIATMTDTGTGCLDMWGGASVVFRFNTVTNCRILAHGVTHAWGPANFEIYNNTSVCNGNSALPDCYRQIHHQGSGEFMIFDNSFTAAGGKSEDAIAYLHYRSWTSGSGQSRCNGTVAVDGNRAPNTTYYGYPCFRQPGRDVNAKLHPIYVWRNRWADTGGKIDASCNAQAESNPNTCTHHVKENRDIFNAVSAGAQTSPSSPFNGTTGMGFGTIANRPSTCTPNSEASDAGFGGVGYWATDEGEWNGNHAGPDGRLYRCSAPNTWTLDYTPLTYPHPLVSGTVAVAPQPPTALSAL